MALPTLDATFASAADLPRRQMLAKWLIEELGSGSIANYYDLPERYLWAKIAVAAGAPRGEADYISLPKNYAWSDIYNAVAGLIPPSNVLVSGAGSSAANGTYTYRGDNGGRVYYNLVGKPDNSGEFSVVWNGFVWGIADENADFYYSSSEDVEFPWLVETWSIADTGSNPVPTVTEIPQQTPNHTDWSENVALGHIAAAYRGDTGNPANLATYIDWPWRYQVAAIIGELTEEPEPSFAPTDLPELELWLDANEGVLNSVGPDAEAANNESVAQWNNKVSGKPNLNQITLDSQPVFKSDVFGRKAVYFNFSGDALHNSGFSTFGQQYSYYLVSTSLLPNNSSSVFPAVRVGTGGTPTNWRGLFGATDTYLGVQNGGTQKITSLSRLISNNFGVFSARFNLGAGEVTVGRNLTYELTTGNSTSTVNSSEIIIGSGGTSGVPRAMDSNYSEVLVYSSAHDEATANQVINYLVQKWSINTSL